jgi:hypothetical protein
MCKALASNPSMQENKKKRKDRGVIGILPEWKSRGWVFINCFMFVFHRSHWLKGTILVNKVLMTWSIEEGWGSITKSLKCQANVFRFYPAATEARHWRWWMCVQWSSMVNVFLENDLLVVYRMELKVVQKDPGKMMWFEMIIHRKEP